MVVPIGPEVGEIEVMVSFVEGVEEVEEVEVEEVVC